MSLLASTHEKDGSVRNEQANQIRTLSAHIDNLEARLAGRDLKLQRVQQKLSRAREENALHCEQIQRLSRQRDDLQLMASSQHADTASYSSSQQQILPDLCAIRDEFGFGVKAERIEQLEQELEQALTCAVIRASMLDPVVTPDRRLPKSATAPGQAQSTHSHEGANELDDRHARQHGKRQSMNRSAGAPEMPTIGWQLRLFLRLCSRIHARRS
jgi:hypothetical protein